MLKQRIFTALALVLLLLGVIVLLPASGFAILLLILIGLAKWEWARLNQWPRSAWVWSILAAASCLLVGFFTLSSQSILNKLQPWSSLVAIWFLLFSCMVWAKVGWWIRVPSLIRIFLGALVLLGTWWALFEMRSHSINFLFSAMAIIWVADIGAYFSGKFLGGRFIPRKLAPSLSPNKTWEGVIGGVVAVLFLALAWYKLELFWGWQPSVFRLLLIKYHLVGTIACLVLIIVFAVMGDLFESMMKRQADAKDSSALLPGHGGILDRVDALLPTMPLLLWLL